MATDAKAVIFDLYGTLIDIKLDEESPEVWEAIAVQPFWGNCYLSGKDLKASYKTILREMAKQRGEGFLLEVVFANLLEQCGVSPSRENLELLGAAFRKKSTVELKKKSYADEVLSSIRTGGYLTGLISNTEELLTLHDLRVLGFSDGFDKTILSSAFGVKKPDVRIFNEMLHLLDVGNKDAVFIGDSFNEDIVGALGAGMKGLFLTEADSKEKSQMESRYDNQVLCASFTAQEIFSALRRFGFIL